MNHQLPSQFTIRVYGLLIRENRILLSKENIKGGIYTKFLGGGLEFGEGVIDCLRREFIEETGIRLNRIEHFYTTEGYFPSAFHTPPKQVLSIYYKVWTDQVDQIQTGKPEDPDRLQNDGDQILYWANLKHLSQQNIQLPIDRIVVSRLAKEL